MVFMGCGNLPHRLKKSVVEQAYLSCIETTRRGKPNHKFTSPGHKNISRFCAAVEKGHPPQEIRDRCNYLGLNLQDMLYLLEKQFDSIKKDRL
jgi:hypothetical protein